MAEDNPHLWVKDFCKVCGVCDKKCPAQAIFDEMTEDKTCIDLVKCAVPFANEYGCTRCIKNCTFFKTDYAVIKEKYDKKS